MKSLRNAGKAACNPGCKAVSERDADRIKHQVVDVKNPIGSRIDAIQSGKLCQFKEQGQRKGKHDSLPEAAVKIIAHIDAKRKQQSQIAADLEPGGVRDIDSAGAGYNPV